MRKNQSASFRRGGVGVEQVRGGYKNALVPPLEFRAHSAHPAMAQSATRSKSDSVFSRIPGQCKPLTLSHAKENILLTSDKDSGSLPEPLVLEECDLMAGG
jgi:hypothetical protein